jgi:hypothetical protein
MSWGNPSLPAKKAPDVAQPPAFMALSPVTAESCAAIPTSLVAWWPFNETTDDVQAWNSGNLVGEGNQFVAGKVGPAFKSGGQGRLMRVEDSSDLDITEFTAESWVKVEAINPSNMPILWKGNGAGAALSAPYGLMILGASHKSEAGKVAPLITDGLRDQLVISHTALPLETFTHIAVTVDGSKLRIYLNGRLDQETDQRLTPFTNDSALQIGSMENALAASSFNGLIDELALYNRPLTAQEIQAIFEAGAQGKCNASLLDPIRPLIWLSSCIDLTTFTSLALGGAAWWYVRRRAQTRLSSR